MAYEPTVWAAGDTITATKLNKLENGVANSGALIVENGTGNHTIVLNKTWSEINSALNAFRPVVYIKNNSSTQIIQAAFRSNNKFCLMSGRELFFQADTANGYPYYDIVT